VKRRAEKLLEEIGRVCRCRRPEGNARRQRHRHQRDATIPVNIHFAQPFRFFVEA
jgi:hypothetical protein